MQEIILLLIDIFDRHANAILALYATLSILRMVLKSRRRFRLSWVPNGGFSIEFFDAPNQNQNGTDTIPARQPDGQNMDRPTGGLLGSDHGPTDTGHGDGDR